MGYRIDYSTAGSLRQPLKKKTSWAAFAALVCVLGLVFGAMLIKNTAFAWVKMYLLPGDPAVTAAALENMAADLKAGQPVWDAITAFCAEIIAHAN